MCIPVPLIWCSVWVRLGNVTVMLHFPKWCVILPYISGWYHNCNASRITYTSLIHTLHTPFVLVQAETTTLHLLRILRHITRPSVKGQRLCESCRSSAHCSSAFQSRTTIIYVFKYIFPLRISTCTLYKFSIIHCCT